MRWYVYDGLGSVVGELDPSGNLTCGKKYDVYGAERSGGTGTATTRQGFCGSLGHIADSETGLVYMRARYYDPSVGRFVSEDPKCSGANWFSYCSNNPVNRSDSTGKEEGGLGDGLIDSMLQILKLWGIAVNSEKIKAIQEASAGISEALGAWKAFATAFKLVGQVNEGEGNGEGVVQIAESVALLNAGAMLASAFAIQNIQQAIALMLTNPDAETSSEDGSSEQHE